MPAYRDNTTGTWFVKFYCKDWTGERKQIKKRGFPTKKDAIEYERKYKVQQEWSLDISFEDFFEIYCEDMDMLLMKQSIGHFKGFELLVEKNFMGMNYLVLRGKTEYKAELSTSPVGSMVKLENLFNGLQENIEFLEKKIEQYEGDLAASKSEYEKPFAYEEEYKQKLKRQCELNAQLDLENDKVADADIGGYEENKITENDREASADHVAERSEGYRVNENYRR